jgi:uncharacterized protein with PQ loop repeat
MPHSEHLLHIDRPRLFMRKLSNFDKLVIIVSIAYPLSALPQAIQVFQGNTDGVSIISWMSFMVCATLFLIYGVKNRVLPMIISNFLWMLMDGLVISGLLFGHLV